MGGGDCHQPGAADADPQRVGAAPAAALSLFAVLQLAVYAALQVPVGVVLDRIGSRRLIAGGALLMGVGQLLLATAHSVGPAVAARVLVGAGDAMTFISVLRLGLWTHFVSQFSGTVFALLWGYPFLVVGEHRSPAEAGILLTLLVIVAMVIGPLLGHLAARWLLRRSVPVLAIVGSAVVVWSVVLAWPGRAPLALLVVLVIVLASNGPGSLMGFDYARTENEAERIGSATGIVNVGGFVASR